MSIITKDPHTWFTVIDKEGNKQTVYNNERYEHNYPFGFQANFSDTPTPPINTVTIYNMAKKHRDFYHRKQKCYLYFNWGTSKKLLSEGYISKIDTNQSDGVTDTLVITFTEGTSYANVQARKLKIKKTKEVTKHKTIKVPIKGKFITKRTPYKVTEVYKRGPKKGQTHIVTHYDKKQVWQKAHTKNRRIKYRGTKTKMVNLSFKAGKSYKTIISGIASQTGIKLESVDLHKNPVMKKAYTAKGGKPLNLIKDLVKKTGSQLTYIRGKLCIVDPHKNHRTWYHIDDKDLVQPPTYNENDGGEGTWEIITPLIPEVTVNVGIVMESRYLKGKYYVKAGQHTSDGENPQTQCSLAKL